MSFTAPVNYDVGKSPANVVTGDFNHDGKLDLATVNTGSNTVSVLLGNGDGSFQPAHTYHVGQSPEAIAVGDLNGDGKLDLVTANFGGTVSVLLGNGDGTFQTARTFRAGNSGVFADSVALADLNGDHKLDIVVGNDSQSDAISVLLGNGDGTFQAPIKTALAQGNGVFSVAVGDLNRDGKPDLVVVVDDSLNPSALVLLGNGNGTFRTGASYALDNDVNGHGQLVVIADLNGDQKLDFVVANSTDVQVFLGNGDGTFAFPTVYNVVGGSVVTVADLNSDGKPDLVVGMFGGVAVLVGNGDGTFQAPQDFATSGFASGVAVGDFNGDGHADLAVANSNANNFSVLLGTGTGSFQQAPSYGLPSNVIVHAGTVADLNGDGIPDLVVVETFGVAVLLGNGDGTFGTPSIYLPNSELGSVAVADVNGDGIPDLVVTDMGHRGSGNTVDVLLGNGDGTFQNPMTFSVGAGQQGPDFVAVADLNGDGNPDLVVANVGGSLPFTTISVLLGNGDGTFQNAMTYTVGFVPTSITIGDVNGDGTPDLIMTGTLSRQMVGGVAVLLGNGDGSFQAATTVASGYNATAAVAGDFNHDGQLDLAVADSTTGKVHLYLGNGDGTFRAGVSYTVGPGPTSLALADINNDGVPDLVVGGNFGVRILTGRANGTFLVPHITYGPSTSFVAVADVNGDDLPDLITSQALLLQQAPRLPDATDGRDGTSRQVWDGFTPAPVGPAPIAPFVPARIDAARELDPARVQSFFTATPDQAWDIAWSRARPRSVLAEDAAWMIDETDLATTLAGEVSAR